MSDQLTHSQSSFTRKEFPIVLLLDNVLSEANLGSMFRLADAFGIQKIIFCGSEPNLNSNRLKRTARNTFKTVSHEYFENPEEVLAQLKKQDFISLALEITATSKPVHDLAIENNQQIVLVAGNERHGITREVLELCDEQIHIDMYGENSSMNVAQSVGIALYEITKGFNKFDKK